MKKNWIALIAALLIPQIFGLVGAAATASSVSTWYRRLRKPSWNPPSQVFAPVWTTLYALMGLASWIVWQKGQAKNRALPERLAPADFAVEDPQARQALRVYGLQLVFNLLWSIIFFGFRSVGAALVEILVLNAMIFETVRRFLRIDRRAAALLVPYQLWTAFATVLTAEVWRLNRRTER